jgi:ADP-ribose pyrophosphatase YjhB (NUDIX family)
VARIDHYRNPDAPRANSIVSAVTAFVQDTAGRVLLIRRTDSGLYAIPGGGQEIGETISQTVVRETAEETGIDVEVAGLIGIYTDPEHVIEYTSDGEVRQEFSICFRATPVGGSPRTSDESSEVHWVAREDLADLDIHPSIRLRIDHGFEHRPEPYYS